MSNHFSCPVISNISQLFLYIIAHLSGEVDTIHATHHPTSLLYKRGLHQYCCSVWKEQEKVLATVHQHSRMEREESEVRAVLYFTWTKVRGVVWHTAPLPHQMLTAMEKTGGCVPLSELVTGVTTRRCCR